MEEVIPGEILEICTHTLSGLRIHFLHSLDCNSSSSIENAVTSFFEDFVPTRLPGLPVLCLDQRFKLQTWVSHDEVFEFCLVLQWLGKLSFVLVPALVLLAVLVGAFAAKTYDSGATSYLAP